MADKKKPTKKGSAAATGAANKTTARARTVKVDELVRHEEALRLNEAVYQQTVDIMEDSLTVLDAEGTFLFANKKAALNLSGGAPSSVVEKNISQFVPKAQAEQLIDKYRRVITTGQPLEQEVMVTLRGVDRWFLNSLRPVSFGVHNIPALVSSSRDITEPKKMEEVLLDSEMRYRTLFEQSGDYILVMKIGKDGVPVITDINETALRANGYSREEMVGRTIAFLDPVTDLRDNDKRIKALKKGELELFTTQHRRKDGSLFDVEVRAQLIRIGGEQIIVSTERDITERKRTEAALKTREKQLAESQRIAHIGSWERNLTTGRMFWSDELFRLFGLDPKKDPADFNTFFNMIHPDDRPALKKAVDETVKTGKHYSIDYRFILRDGTTRIIHAQAKLLPDESGKLVILSGTGQDSTERKRAEEALHESERSLKTLMSNLPGMAYRCCNDRNWTMEYVSEGAVGLTGYQPADLIGNAKIAYNDLIRPDDQEPVWEAVQKAVGSRDKFTLNYRIRRADGQERWVWEQGQGVFSSAGDLLALEGFIIDVSERCLLEEERLKTQKLESIGTLAGGIAHDFNNLLQGIFGYISMAKMTLDQKEKSLAMLEQSEKALHQSVNLTTQLLTFSKGGKPVKRSLSLPPVIENAARFALSGSHCEHRISSAPDLWRVEADEGQLGQVIQNIVLNADQAMPLGGCVEIAAQNVSASDASLPRSIAGKDHVLITIRDSGIGIPEQYLGKIFDPYFTTKEKGSGLGLATSYSIIRNHEGLIDVRSQVGKGTAFFLYLPASEAVAEESQTAAAPGMARTGRVLVMDDEKVVREVAGELLRALGHEAEFAENGEAALTMYREAMASAKPFDVVILDLTIRGGMGGLETVGKLLEIDSGAKAVVSSGYSDEAALSNYREHGFRAFLKKPYNMKELQNTLSDMLG